MTESAGGEPYVIDEEEPDYDYDIGIALDANRQVHIHQQQCFVPVVHRRHMISVGEYEGTAYFYQCLGLTPREKAWKREKRV